MSEEKEIVKFDANQYMDQIKDKIKASFAKMIPDEVWEGMLKKEVQEFFYRDLSANRNSFYSDSGQYTQTNFGRVCQNMLQEMAKEKIKERLNDPQYMSKGGWNEFGPEVSERLHQMLIDNADNILANTLGNMMQMVVENMRTRY